MIAVPENYIEIIDAEIQGIPCKIGIEHYEKVKGSYSFNAQSDLDYHGYIVRDWVVLDVRGRKADWLSGKMIEEDVREIERLIDEAMEVDP